MATYTNLDNEIFAQNALQAFVKVLAPLASFSTNFSSDASQKGANILVPLIASLTATTFGGSYAICGGTKTVVTIPLTQHKHVYVGQHDIEAANSSASSLESFAYQQGRALATLMLEDIFTLLTTANFGSATAISSTVMDVAQLRRARLLLNQANVPMEPRAAIIDCVPYDVLLSVTNFVQAHMFRDNTVLSEGKIMRALGFDMYETNSTFGSVNSVMAFCGHASSIAVAMRYLQPQPGHTYNDARAVTDPQTGMTLGLRDHYDNNTGTRYINLEALYGYSAGITNGARLIKRLD